MKNQVTIFAPATIANLGSGFDVLGFALEDLGDRMTLSLREDDQLIIRSIRGAKLPFEPSMNIAGIVIEEMRTEMGIDQGIDIDMEKCVLPGSGLGSSASSAAGAAVAFDLLFNCGLDRTSLTKFAIKGEEFISQKAHADNVAPCIYGGCTLVRDYDPLEIVEIPVNIELHICVVHPQVEIRTADAKRVLDREISLDLAITQWGNLGALIQGFNSGDLGLIGRSMKDVIAEPKRAGLIPGFEQIRSIAAGSGIGAFGIAGSGPSMFAFTEDIEQANQLATRSNEYYSNEGIEVNTYVSSIGNRGAYEVL